MRRLTPLIKCQVLVDSMLLIKIKILLHSNLPLYLLILINRPYFIGTLSY